ncbi:MAG: sensor histidine kinase [Pedobacter sp.]|nr:MAG: sensor histidine kinase [Pedobacter sp.]
MKKVILILLSFILMLSTVNAQKGINYSYRYWAGGKLSMCVDSGATNVVYNNIFPNQPNTSFNYLPDVNNVSIHIRKNINVDSYRYTILVDDKPIAVNKPIDKENLKNFNMHDVLSSTTLGNFSVKDKIITSLVYSIENPLNIDKAIFYGRQIPRAQIKFFSKIIALDRGFASQTDFKERTNFSMGKNDKELVIIKDRSVIDYHYYTSLKDKKTNKIIFRSTAWEYGHFTEKSGYLPHVNIDKNVFKKSGEYEIIIQPLLNWNISPKEKEKYTTRHTLYITLDEENYSKKDFIINGLIICALLGAIGGATLTYIKKKEAKKLVQQYKEKEIAQLQLSSIRSQLNPHFMFNALSSIQNLMNKNEIDSANKYLAKFARLTRNVLNDKELISLAQEKTLLDDYLQMEQLRFGFNYEINFSENLALDNIDIPSMLLQPFVENAVKHGISQKATEGKVTITFMKQTNDLLLTVTDNGNGFDIEKISNGLGMKLSEQRIALLNSVYKENRFSIDIKSTTNGTKISLTLTDWLS